MTRGGLATALNEIAAGSVTRMHVDETKILARDEVRAACELLGLDPLYLTNEGRFIAALGSEAKTIGCVEAVESGVVMRSCIGRERFLDMLGGEQLLRIC